MSIRHYNRLLEQVFGTVDHTMPKAQVLALPDRLDFCSLDTYNPCDFGTPTGAPRLLSPECPVIVDGPFTYIYMRLETQDGPVHTYTKLEEPGES